MSPNADELYRLLPAVYRQRDAEQGGALKALVTVLAEQAEVLHADIERLYDGWFIETCDEWLVPYLGDLLGVRGLHTVPLEAGYSQRARVANTLAYRRRKGTATVLEQLAFDTTGWRARAVEFFERLGWTQHYNHVRLLSHRTPDLRRSADLELIGGPFETASRAVDVRRIAINRGWHNIPNIGLFVWRLAHYPVSQSDARAVATPADGRHTFHPVGLDAPLFNPPQTETEITHLATELNVPAPLRRRPLYDELEARRQAIADSTEPEYAYFDDRAESLHPPVLQIFVDNETDPVPPEEIDICDLSDWHRPPATRDYVQHDALGNPLLDVSGNPQLNSLPIRVAVDPELGRITFPSAVVPAAVRVSFAYGFSGDLGGGPYNRRDSLPTGLDPSALWQAGVSRTHASVAGEPIFPTVREAVAAWDAQLAGPNPQSTGLIVIMDSRTYDETLDPLPPEPVRVTLPEGTRLVIIAAQWPEEETDIGPQRSVGRLEAEDLRPLVIGDWEIHGTAPDGSPSPGELILNGLLIEGAVSVLDGNLGRLRIEHSTLVPSTGGMNVESGNSGLHLEFVRSMGGPIQIGAGGGLTIGELRIDGSIVDAAASSALAVAAGDTDVAVIDSTIFGAVDARSLEASNAIFTGRVEVERRQTGCVRFSFVPPGSHTPRQYRCQPSLAVGDLVGRAKAEIEARLIPAFTSSQFGHPAYAQLGRFCPEEIRTGADDRAEMGAFRFLQQPQREANLRTALDEYLRLGLEAGVIPVT